MKSLPSTKRDWMKSLPFKERLNEVSAFQREIDSNQCLFEEKKTLNET